MMAEDTDDEELLNNSNLQEIYYIEVVGKGQGDQIGPIDYGEFKKRYQDDSYGKLTYMSPMRDATEYPEWRQIFKIDKIFQDLDPEKYQQLKANNPTVATEEDELQQQPVSSNYNNVPLAQPVSIGEMRQKEAEEEQQRLTTEDDGQAAVIDPKASYQSSSCCVIV